MNYAFSYDVIYTEFRHILASYHRHGDLLFDWHIVCISLMF